MSHKRSHEKCASDMSLFFDYSQLVSTFGHHQEKVFIESLPKVSKGVDDPPDMAYPFLNENKLLIKIT